MIGLIDFFGRVRLEEVAEPLFDSEVLLIDVVIIVLSKASVSHDIGHQEVESTSRCSGVSCL